MVVSGETAHIIYFTHPNGQDYPPVDGKMPPVAKRSPIQGGELGGADGKLTCDRNKPFRIRMEATP